MRGSLGRRDGERRQLARENRCEGVLQVVEEKDRSARKERMLRGTRPLEGYVQKIESESLGKKNGSHVRARTDAPRRVGNRLLGFGPVEKTPEVPYARFLQKIRTHDEDVRH